MSSAVIVRRPVVAAFVACVLASMMAPASSPENARRVTVIVQSLFGAGHAGESVEEAGGETVRRLPIVRGVTATVPASSLDELRARPELRITPNGLVAFENIKAPDTGRFTDAPTEFSLEPQRVQRMVGSDRLWSEGVTGRGVTVALIDTGVHAAHPDLAGRVVHCEDFSHEAGTEAHCADTFGHGTFMAGLIAGNGASSDGRYKGAAPEANIVSLKVAGFDGSTDVSHVLAAIQWVVAHRSTYKIKVLNLSLGSDSAQTYMLSPLNYAVQRAWKSGVTVVVSAGNSGPDQGTVLKPADDPYVVTVGASDDRNTMATGDDRVPVFSSKGPTRSNGVPKPDVVAPGVHTISLRSPGSAIDQNFGGTAVVDGSYFRGTGTSMSAATATGVVAQILQAAPSLSPDQIKSRLMKNTKQISETNKYAAGTGLIDAYGAARSTSTAKANQGLLLGLGTGLGSLQSDRGTIAPVVYTPMGELALNGEVKPQYKSTSARRTRMAIDPLGLLPWLGVTYTSTGWDPTTWVLTSWVTADWASMRWRDGSYSSTVWESMRWRGSTYSNEDWDSMRWRGFDWTSMRWRATTWQTKWYAAAWD